jgi:sulfoxide reductase heme-binding subunit YedZ
MMTPSNHRWPPEKVVAFAVAVAPAVWLAGLAYECELGVRAVTEAIKVSGDWALRLLWLVLLVGPARRILSAPRLFWMRRILGLGAFGLTVLHFGPMRSICSSPGAISGSKSCCASISPSGRPP